MNDARVVCRNLNFISTISALPDIKLPHGYEVSSLHAGFSQFECLGSEQSLGLCKSSYLGTGSQTDCNTYAGVICNDKVPNGKS